MAYEFKRLADAELLESVPDGATAFIETEGVVKRVPGDGLGGGGIPTAIFRMDYTADSASTLAAGDGARQAATIYTATCDNMTFDEAKAILLAGNPLDARLIIDATGLIGEGVLTYECAAATSTGMMEYNGTTGVGATFAPGILGWSSTTFYWLADGTITTDFSILGG